MEYQRPALGFAQVSVARHCGARHAEAHRVVVAQQAALAAPSGVMEIGGRRCEPLGGRPITSPGDPMASRALLLVQPTAHGRVGRLHRGERNRILAQQVFGHVRGQGPDVRAIDLAGNGLFQFLRGFDELCLAVHLRQIVQTASDICRKFTLFGVFPCIEHLTILNELGIVDSDVIDHLQDRKNRFPARSHDMAGPEGKHADDCETQPNRQSGGDPWVHGGPGLETKRKVSLMLRKLRIDFNKTGGYGRSFSYFNDHRQLDHKKGGAHDFRHTTRRKVLPASQPSPMILPDHQAG